MMQGISMEYAGSSILRERLLGPIGELPYGSRGPIVSNIGGYVVEFHNVDDGILAGSQTVWIVG